MRIRLPVRANRKLRRVIERVNEDRQLKALVARRRTSTPSCGCRSTTTPGCTSRSSRTSRSSSCASSSSTASSRRSSATTGSPARTPRSSSSSPRLLHCIGMSVHRRGHEDWSLFLAEPKMRAAPRRRLRRARPHGRRLRGAAVDHEPSRRRRAALARGRHPARRRRARHGEGPLPHPVRARLGVDPLALRGGDRRGAGSPTATSGP